VGLELGLDVVVGEILTVLLAVVAEEGGELGIGEDLTAILGVLELVLLDVGADILGDVDARAELTLIPAGELGELLGDLDGLHEAGVGRAGLVGALDLGDAVDISAESLEGLGNRASETESVELGLALSGEGGDGVMNEGLKSIEIVLDGLLGDDAALVLSILRSISDDLGGSGGELDGEGLLLLLLAGLLLLGLGDGRSRGSRDRLSSGGGLLNRLLGLINSRGGGRNCNLLLGSGLAGSRLLLNNSRHFINAYACL
jgi:hypothetical protein